MTELELRTPKPKTPPTSAAFFLLQYPIFEQAQQLELLRLLKLVLYPLLIQEGLFFSFNILRAKGY